ncbi:hypothetical protein UFOVP45_44 [uncultured Caudovirales phage]|uniref:Uncharacterized protein n=1 Tax=uncultured Caudovirales phage TaxID=2100421 RepID=A0A6J5KUP2_9CAUD|nr:hypothetical protein UFOVP45_44 [uncultured Caudovirales phage]
MYSNPSSKNRRSTSFVISFPSLPSFKALPRTVELYQEAYMHDRLVISFPKISDVWFKTLKRGVQIQFSWKQGTSSNVWIGYVNSVNRRTVGQREQLMEITCVGASAVLKQRSQEVFKNKTIPEVAQIIAAKYKLHFVGEPDSRRFPHLPISGQSYWQWLVEHAKLIGYVVYMDGITLVFRPIDKVLDSGASNAPLLSMHSTDLPINSQPFDRTLDELRVINGDYNEGTEFSNTNKIVGGIDPITGKPLYSAKIPNKIGRNLRVKPSGVIYDEYQTDKVVNTTTAVESVATGAAQLSRFNIPAKIVGQGDVRTRPYSLVQVSGTGDVTDGFWVVLKVHHMIHRVGDYQMEISAVTDGIGQNTNDSFRKANLSDVGIVDVAAILSGNTNTANLSQVNAKVASKYPMFAEVGQGFVDNPMYWEVSYRSQEGCCS